MSVNTQVYTQDSTTVIALVMCICFCTHKEEDNAFTVNKYKILARRYASHLYVACFLIFNLMNMRDVDYIFQIEVTLFDN